MEISSFYTSVPKIMIICYTVPEIWRMMDVIAIYILGYTFPFFLPNSPKNENFKTMKKRLGDIILHKCTKNHDHMLYCYWDMTRARCNCYFSFWTIFSPFTPLTAQKMKISKKWKKTPEDIINLQNCTKNHGHTVYCSWDMESDGCNCYLSFWSIFCLLPPNSPKMKISKQWKKHLEIS